jgi:hypothetical protein
MRIDYEENICDYEVITAEGLVVADESGVACFADLPNSKEGDTIKIYSLLCEHTKSYIADYMDFINEIQPMDWDGGDVVSFKSTGTRAKDMAICCMIRMLWEKNDINLNLFFNTLLYELKEKDPIKRFIKAYNTKGVIGHYTGQGHAFGYSMRYKLALANKSLKTWKKATNFKNHYDFFTNSTVKRSYK